MVAPVFGPYVTEPTLARAHLRAREKAGHMSASDQITQAIVVTLQAGGRPHMAPRRSLPDDRRPEALAVAGRRPGWGRARRSGPEPAGQTGRQAPAPQAAEKAGPGPSCHGHGQAGQLRRCEGRGDALSRAPDAPPRGSLYGDIDVKVRVQWQRSSGFVGRKDGYELIRGEFAIGRGSSRRELVSGGPRGARTMMQPCASAAKLRGGGSNLNSGSEQR